MAIECIPVLHSVQFFICVLVIPSFSHRQQVNGEVIGHPPQNSTLDLWMALDVTPEQLTMLFWLYSQFGVGPCALPTHGRLS